MEPERGTLGTLPYLAAGQGEPFVLFAGLAPDVGFDGKAMRRVNQGLLAPFADSRRTLLFNRRRGLPRGMTMAELATEHADAIRAGFDGPVDVAGMSTGGSIAQQMAADHPDVVRRLVLISTGCRLVGLGKRMQRQAAARVRAGAEGKAFAIFGSALTGNGALGVVTGTLSRVLGPRLFPDGLADMATTIEAEDEFDLARCARPVAAPTLILAGARDRFYSRELFEETARLVPGSTLRLFEGRGHITVTNDPGFWTALGAFLAPA